MDGFIDRCMMLLMYGYFIVGCMDLLMDVWIYLWMDRFIDGWMDLLMCGRIY